MQKEKVLTKQTAIDWLISQIEEGSATSETYEFIYIKIPYNALKQAKEMEKKQIKDAHHNGFTEGTCFGAAYMYRYKTSEEYYNETYGGENEQD